MNILVTVVGRVSYDSRSAGTFHQTFILGRRPDGKYFVANDAMRLVESM
jgi:Nuclear transport factor 2 (NTF2) domain